MHKPASLRAATTMIKTSSGGADEDVQFALELESKSSAPSSGSPSAATVSASVLSPRRLATIEIEDVAAERFRAPVELTPASTVPGARITRQLGRVCLPLVRERVAFKDKESEHAEDGLGLFTHELITEAQALLRAHVAALGGNALVGYRIDEFRVNERTDSNDRGYCLISISGDAIVLKHTLSVA